MRRAGERFANLFLRQNSVSDEGTDEDQFQMIQSISAFKEGKLLVDESSTTKMDPARTHPFPGLSSLICRSPM